MIRLCEEWIVREAQTRMSSGVPCRHAPPAIASARVEVPMAAAIQTNANRIVIGADLSETGEFLRHAKQIGGRL